MFDSFGDGWHGNTFSIGDQFGTLDDGDFGEFQVCLVPGCYMVSVDGGPYQEEISWLFDDNDGSAPFHEEICVGNAEVEIQTDTLDCYTYTIQMWDSFGDGWSGNTFEIDGQSGTLIDGEYGEFEVCLEPGCYWTTVGGGAWKSDISWEFAGISGGAPFEQSVCVGGDDDIIAIGQDVDFESCGQVYTMHMHDSFGDTWNGNFFEIDGNIGTMDEGVCSDRVYDKNMEICIQPGCHHLFVGGGNWMEEVSWEFAGHSGGAPFDEEICF